MKKRSNTPKTNKSLREEIIGLGDRSVSKSYYPQLQEQIKLLQEAKKKAEESKTILHLFIKYSPAAIAMFDREMRYVAVSQRWLTDYDLGKKQIIGRSHYEVFPEIPERWKEIHRRCLAGAIEKAEEDPFVRMDGTIDWIQWEIHPWQTTTGEIGGIIIFSEVITEQKKVKDALRESEERWKFALEGSGDGVWDWNAQTNEVFFSRRWKEMIGYEEHEIGNTLDEWDKRVHPDDKKMVYEEIEKHFRGETDIYVSEHRVLCKDGTYKWILDRGKVIKRTDEGNPLRIIGTHTDITYRKQAEDILETRLRISEFAATHSEDEIIQATLDEAERLSRSSIGFFHYVEDDQKTLRLQMWSTNTIRKMCAAERKKRHYPISKAGVWVDCVLERGPVIHNDYKSLPHKKGLPQGHAKVVRELVLPIIIGEKIHALIGVGNKETNYNEIDVKIVSDLAYMSWDIIKRKRAEEALQKSEEQFKAITSHTPDHISIQDSELRYLFVVNPQLGLTEQDMIGKTDYDFLSKEEADKITKIKTQVLHTGRPVNLETSLISQSGKPEFFEGTYVPRFDAQGRINGLIGYFRNITKRKQAEQTIKNSENFLNSIIEQSPYAIWISDEKGTLIRINQACAKLLNITADEVVGKYNVLKDSIVQEQGYMPLVQAVFEKGRTAHFEIIYDSAQLKHLQLERTTSIVVDVTIFPITDANGKITNAIIQHMDITKRRQAEAALRESEDKFKHVFESANVGKSITLPTGELTVNKAFADLLGYSQEELRNKTWQDLTPPDEIESTQKKLAPILNGEQDSIRFDKRYIHKNGSYIWADVSVAIRRDSEGKPLHFITTIVDITERKQAEEALRYHEALLEETGRIAKVGGWEFNAITGEGTWTDEVARIHDLDPEEYTNVEKGLNFYQGESRTKIETAVKEAIELGKPYDLQLELVTVKGNHKWVRTIGHPIIENSKVVKVRGSFQDITERKQLEHEREKFMHLADSSSEFIGMCDLEMNPIYVNPAGIRMVGLSDMRAACSVKVQDYFFPEDQDFIRDDFFPRVLRNGHGDVEIRLRHFQTGEPIWMFYYLFHVLDANGTPIGWATVSRDITDRKKAEEALRESEDKFKYVFESANVGKSITLPTGEITVNKAYADLLGYSQEELRNKTWQELTPPDEIEAIQKILFPLLNGEKDSVRFDKRYIHKNGSYIWADVSVAIRRDHEGKPLHFITTIVDITERKQAEDKLRASEATVRKKLDAIIEPDGDIGTLELSDIIDAKLLQSILEDFYRLTGMLGAILDTSGNILVAVGWQDICTKFHRCHPETNKNCIESDTILTHGVSPGSFKAYQCKNHMWDMVTPLMLGGRHVGNVFIGQFFYEDEMPDVELFREQARKYGFDETEYLAALDRVPRFRKETVDTCMQFYAKLAGIISTLSFSAIQQSRLLAERKKADDELRKYRVHLEDLVKERTEELEQANIRLKELDRLKSMFIASMSHELRTPLNSVIGFSSILMKDWVGTLNDEQKNMSSIILKAGKHLLSLINDVIDVSKIEAGMIDIHHDDFNVDEVITDAVESLTKEIQDKGLLLNVEIIYRQMHTDRGRLLQCILNLLSNAMKFTEKGYITVGAALCGCPDKKGDHTGSPLQHEIQHVEISVTDTGIGIKEEDIPKLFQAFVRLETPLKAVVPGTGLGLYLTKKLVTEVLQGDITVESKYGEGSKFIMKIPISVNSEQ